MLSPQLRQKVFKLWTMFWSSGMTNPLTSIEQITYLLFLKRLESLDAERIRQGKKSIYGPRLNCRLPHHEDDKPGDDGECQGHPTCKWSYIRQNTSHDHISQYVFPWLRALDETMLHLGNGENRVDVVLTGQRMMEDAYFQLPREKVATLQRAIATIDDLFKHVDARSGEIDIMGDIFEYLLSEIKQSGKNGQFRTPRHIIRLMVELLDPKPGEKVVDPAAGTGGFLFSSIQHLLKQTTDPQNLVLEWDGTPHRLTGGDPEVEKYLTGEFFTGYDNDRTMVRIGWMNMILHGIENPSIERRDSLGKSLPETESGKYKIVLANPPFTGNVDEEDIHEIRFPRNPNKSSDPITTKSELLFVWLMLDLLEVGGRCAVIVPEGVLFGSTVAHRELRRELLFKHDLKAVISLPAGVFQPYSGVKTSILLFYKVGDKLAPGNPPRSEWVWFYEIKADGYSLDARRDPRPQPNDLWDVLEKYPKSIEDSQYHQPEIYTERWRMVDEDSVRIFPELAGEMGKVWGIHELFRELPPNPQKAENKVKAEQHSRTLQLYLDAIAGGLQSALENEDKGSSAREKISSTLTQYVSNLNRLFNSQIRELLDNEFDKYASQAIKSVLTEVEISIDSTINKYVDLLIQGDSPDLEILEWNRDLVLEEVISIVREFAKLDGFNVQLRTQEVSMVLPENHPYSVKVEFDEDDNGSQSDYTYENLSWIAPVRVYARDDDWQIEDNQIKGSHDSDGNVRKEYIESLQERGVFEHDGTLKTKFMNLLEPDCIEANDFNLSAGRYKPFILDIRQYEHPTKILNNVRELETQLIAGIDRLKAMVEGDE